VSFFHKIRIRIPLIPVPYIHFKVNENSTPTNRKVNVKGYCPYFIRAVISTSGTFIAYSSTFSVYPDFAECFVLFPTCYVGLLTATADGIQGTSHIIFGKLSYRLNVQYYVGSDFMMFSAF
jgi:hypothetical protein